MDSFELNKVLGAVLGTCLALLSLNIAAGAMFTPHNPEKPGYEIAVKEDAASGKPGEAAPAEEPLPVRFASADVGRGENAAKKCAACHTFGKGEPNRVGPNLWGVVGRPKASEAGFNYSAAMKGQKGNWTPEDLDIYLTNPKAMVPGTNMTFAGIPRGKERADVITYPQHQVGQAGGTAEAGRRRRRAAATQPQAAGDRADSRRRPCCGNGRRHRGSVTLATQN